MRPGGGADRTFAAGTEARLAASGPATEIALQDKGRIVALAEPCCGTTKTFSLFRLRGGTDHTRCLRHPATIVGTGGPDEIVGTPHRDVIAGLAGKDTIRGLGGPDLICGGKGRNRIFGGAGRDRIRP
jgi:Ca2+-binding RTX toxin-like protein